MRGVRKTPPAAGKIRAWSDDLESGCSGPIETFTVAALLALVARPALTLVSAYPD
jgi:hypothetical protein